MKAMELALGVACAAAGTVFGTAFAKPLTRPSYPAAWQASSPSARNPQYVVIGCVRAQSSPTDRRRNAATDKTFFITDVRDKALTYRLEGDPNELDLHVGHMIEAKGDISASGGVQDGRGGAPPTLNVKSLIYISRTCSQ